MEFEMTSITDTNTSQSSPNPGSTQASSDSATTSGEGDLLIPHPTDSSEIEGPVLYHNPPREQHSIRELAQPDGWQDTPNRFSAYVPDDPATAPQIVTRLQRARFNASASQFDATPIIHDDDGFHAYAADVKDAVDEPTSVQQALAGKHKTNWRDAISAEHNALWQRGVIRLKLRDKNGQLIPTKTTFKIKRDADGNVSKFKVRVCACGNRQKINGLDDTYSPAGRLHTLRALFATAAQHGMHFAIGDISTAYLYADNSAKDVAITIPDGMILHIPSLLENEHSMRSDQKMEIADLIRKFGKAVGKETYEVTPELRAKLVLELLKSLYGLRNAGRDWNKEINHILTERLGFTRSSVDPCLYHRGEGAADRIWVFVFVDDIVQVSPSRAIIDEFQRALNNFVKLNNTNNDLILGIKIEHDSTKSQIKLTQKRYIDELLARFGFSDAKPQPTPDSQGEHLEEPRADDVKLNENEKFIYQKIVGGLLYLAICTRPDIASAVRQVGRFASEPTIRHLTAAKRILRYLKGTATLGITYTKNSQPNELHAFVDASWGEDKLTRKSTTGYIFLLSGGPISWISKQQTTVALSSCEAEYTALATALQEALHLSQLFSDAKIPLDSPTVHVMEDNQSAIFIAENPASNNKTKHMDIKLHFVREVLDRGKVLLHYCPTDKNLADILTKAIQQVKFKRLGLQLLGVSPTEYIVTPRDPAQDSSVEGGVLTRIPTIGKLQPKNIR